MYLIYENAPILSASRDRVYGTNTVPYRRDNEIVIIRDAPADWLLALAGVQSVPEDYSLGSRHNVIPAKNAARRIYFARKRLLDYPFTDLRSFQNECCNTRRW